MCKPSLTRIQIYFYSTNFELDFELTRRLMEPATRFQMQKYGVCTETLCEISEISTSWCLLRAAVRR